MHDSSASLLPYVAGFALCVGAVFLLVACTAPVTSAGADPGARGDDTVVVQQGR
ncbi:hypothetical protein ACFQ58_03165 [Agromyces sp. NPDC056523]|uniref:hypothetical protein n=1 Tax=Agromyces sp. NPDC056523 TaxID=3345850 RepID=UPI003670C84E